MGLVFTVMKEMWLHYVLSCCNKQSSWYCVSLCITNRRSKFFYSYFINDNLSDGCVALITQITDEILNIGSSLQLIDKNNIYFV